MWHTVEKRTILNLFVIHPVSYLINSILQYVMPESISHYYQKLLLWYKMYFSSKNNPPPQPPKIVLYLEDPQFVTIHCFIRSCRQLYTGMFFAWCKHQRQQHKHLLGGLSTRVVQFHTHWESSLSVLQQELNGKQNCQASLNSSQANFGYYWIIIVEL